MRGEECKPTSVTADQCQLHQLKNGAAGLLAGGLQATRSGAAAAGVAAGDVPALAREGLHIQAVGAGWVLPREHDSPRHSVRNFGSASGRPSPVSRTHETGINFETPNDKTPHPSKHYAAIYHIESLIAVAPITEPTAAPEQCHINLHLSKTSSAQFLAHPSLATPPGGCNPR